MTLFIPAHIVWQDVPGDLALFDTETGNYYALNGSAADIWREIAAGADADTAAARLAEAYGARQSDVRADVADFVADALDKGVLVAAPA